MKAIIAKKIKDKPKYNIWQNSTYVLQGAWKRNRYVVYSMIGST